MWRGVYGADNRSEGECSICVFLIDRIVLVEEDFANFNVDLVLLRMLLFFSTINIQISISL